MILSQAICVHTPILTTAYERKIHNNNKNGLTAEHFRNQAA